LGLVDEIEITAEAGYDGIEPWIRELDAYVEGGGSLSKLAQIVERAGLDVPNAIGFFEWAVDDVDRRAAALDEARRNLDMCAAIGCERLAAPPSGITDAVIPLPVVAERYRAVLDLAEGTGVTPVVEFWGISRTLGRLGEAVYVAMESGHRDACVLADVYHMYKGGSPHNGLRLVGPQTLGLVHMNDYPPTPDLKTISDADRLYPGDGIAPLGQILRDLQVAGFRGMLSLELFNETYWAQDANSVARTGLERMQAAVEVALEL
jgi:sugar phosphate isomerase/epimerase